MVLTCLSEVALPWYRSLLSFPSANGMDLTSDIRPCDELQQSNFRSVRVDMFWGKISKLIYLITHLSAYLRLRRVLSRDQRACVERHCKWADLKHVRAYGARFLDKNEKYDFITFHYNFVLDWLSLERSREVLAGRAYLWETVLSGNMLGIELRRSTLTSIEGELVLNFAFNSRVIFMLTFTVVPGAYFGESARPLIFIGGMQGRPACREDIRAASKLNKEIDPATMLLMALKTIGIAWNIETIAAISARHQISANALESSKERSAVYDRFWVESGGTPYRDKVYKLRTHFQRGAQDPALGTHRSRTRRKRMAKEALRSDLLTATSRIFATTDFLVAT
jgi:uncharacterized protein VirK/YbjX